MTSKDSNDFVKDSLEPEELLRVLTLVQIGKLNARMPDIHTGISGSICKVLNDLIGSYELIVSEISTAEKMIRQQERFSETTEMPKASDQWSSKVNSLNHLITQMMILSASKDLEKQVFERNIELEKLNNELKDLNLLKDKFLSGITHDLRNPLTALLISSDKLSRDSENHHFEDMQPMVDIIHRSSNKILQKLNELDDRAKEATKGSKLQF